MDILSIKGATTIYKTGNSILKLLEENLDNIQAELGSMYLDIANSHFAAAKDTLSLANSKSDTSTVLQETITHLRAAFFLYQTSIIRMVKKSSFFSSKEVPFLNEENKEMAFIKQMEIAILLVNTYRFLEDHESVKSWHDRLKDIAAHYLSVKHSLIREEAVKYQRNLTNRKAVNDNVYKDLAIFVKNREGENLNSYREQYYEYRQPHSYATWSNFELFDEGKKYLRQMKEKDKKMTFEQLDQLLSD